MMTAEPNAATWRDEVLKWAASVAEHDDEIRDVLVFGSIAYGASTDVWSDVDLAVVALPEALERIASAEWLSPLGTIWAWDRSGMDDRRTFRAVFADGRRIDVIAVEDELAVGLAGRSLIDGHGLGAASDRRAPHDLGAMTNSFRFAAAVAATKVGRNDLLIGLHLTYRLLSDCLVLGMLLRNQETGVEHHRFGGLMNELAHRTSGLAPAGLSTDGLLRSIRGAVDLFDELAVRLEPAHRANTAGLDALIAAARLV